MQNQSRRVCVGCIDEPVWCVFLYLSLLLHIKPSAVRPTGTLLLYSLTSLLFFFGIRKDHVPYGIQTFGWPTKQWIIRRSYYLKIKGIKRQWFFFLHLPFFKENSSLLKHSLHLEAFQESNQAILFLFVLTNHRHFHL